MHHIDAIREGNLLRVRLSGEWEAARVQDAAQTLSRIDLTGIGRIEVSTAQLGRLDLASAWALDQFLLRAAEGGTPVEFDNGEPPALRLVRSTLDTHAASDADLELPTSRVNPVHAIGQTTVARYSSVRRGLYFLGRVCATLLAALRQPRRLRPISVVRHIYDTGISAIPIVALIAFLISVIIAYLSATQLRSFGADIFVVDLITVGVLRELGVLLTAIIIAGRSGSAFAAEIGAMRLNEEVDALSATGVDFIEVLVLPRIIGLTIALPLLTFIADIIGMAGGALLCHSLLNMPLQQFIHRANLAIAPTTFWVGLWKAPCFAILIALSGTYRGLQVRSSSRELGRLTTVAVVQAIFLVLLADALFAMLFMKLDI